MPQVPHRSLVLVADVGTEPFHVGDEAMLAANVEALRRFDPDVRLTVIGREAGGPARLSRATAAALDGAGGLFLSGGGNLSSSWPELLHQRIEWMREARRRGLPIVTGGQTIGPELDPADRSALAEALAGVEHLGVRELPSAALALQMGVPSERLSYQLDDAFFLAGRPPAGDDARSLPDEPYLLVTLDPAFAAARSRAGLCSFAVQLARIAATSGLHLVFLPHVGPLGAPGDEDGSAGAALAGLLRAEGARCTLLPVMPTAETVWLTRQAAAVVSSRYHPLVFGTAAAVPCLGIYRDAYTRIKLQGALAHVGMEAWCQSAVAAEGGGLVSAFRRLWSRRDELRAEMERARAPLTAQEERRWRRLLERLGWRRPDDATPAALHLGWPADRLAAAALTALALERQAGDAESGHWRGVVHNLERSVDLAGRRIRDHRERDRERRRDLKNLEGSNVLTEQQWNDYSRDGFLRLGKVLEPEEVEALKQRADDLALGNVKNPNVQMQLDTGGAYEDLPAAVRSFDHGTMLYRKIQGLETDDLFTRLVRHPLFLEVCARQYGPHSAISIFRAMVMNKPAGQGTVLPWHQDGGNVWALDRDPLVTLWVALDPATRANGCMEIVPGTHRLGLLSLYGSTVEEEDVQRHCPPALVQPLEVEPGHAVLLHNWLIHRSGLNPSPVPRRAFTACYMDGRTQSILTGDPFPLVAGSLPAEPYPYLHQLRHDCAALREAATRAEEYARSLEEERERRGLTPAAAARRHLSALLSRVRNRLAPAR
jgi:polysaccharide pyruvyl transferase WcaK-like protein